jgi:hypothetical protein
MPMPGRSNGGSLRRAYQTADHAAIASEHALVLMPADVTGAAGEVGTSAHAICGAILTSIGYRCPCRCVEEHAGADESDRKKKLPCHVRTSWERRAGHAKF